MTTELQKLNRHYRRVHTMKVMRIGSELIRIACVHTECALTAIRFESIHFHRWFETGLKRYCITIRLARDVFAGIV